MISEPLVDRRLSDSHIGAVIVYERDALAVVLSKVLDEGLFALCHQLLDLRVYLVTSQTNEHKFGTKGRGLSNGQIQAYSSHLKSIRITRKSR